MKGGKKMLDFFETAMAVSFGIFLLTGPEFNRAFQAKVNAEKEQLTIFEKGWMFLNAVSLVIFITTLVCFLIAKTVLFFFA